MGDLLERNVTQQSKRRSRMDRVASAVWRTLGIVVLCVGMPTTGITGESDRYRYVLELGKGRKVCAHMQTVYEMHFGSPWKRPVLTVSASDPAYGPGGSYSFPKLPNVAHDNRMAFQMALSRLPTSLEFEAIEWREGRYRFVWSGKDHGAQPILVAEFDINNDGHPDTVVKRSFMISFWPSHGSVAGGEDNIFVFKKGELDLTQPLGTDVFIQDGKRRSVMIPGGYSRRLVRPFVVGGIVYLSAYEQVWEGGEFMRSGTKLNAEYTNVLRYRGGGENLGPRKWTDLQLDEVCKFRMRPVRLMSAR